MTKPPARDLVALVGSRIAHDIISPLGAIGNGIELLGLSAAADTPELALITDSVENAKARIRMFRIAFGAAELGQNVRAAEIRALLAPAADGRKIQIDWQPTGDLDRAATKLVFLVLLCLETAMPWGGTVQVSTTGESWKISAHATRLSVDDRLWALLSAADLAVGLTPAQVHFALAGDTARAQDRELRVTQTDTGITITF